ncbi:MAG: hypothetical protein J0M02_06765 [Planctomycetes bacterium]|nr:hypothetical protein [Planctomycetota bacterium]
MLRPILALAFAATCAAADPVLDPCVDAKAWIFSPGKEFPGATGSLAAASGGLTLAWDFSAGGHYVAAQCTATVPAGTTAVAFELEAALPCAVTVRMQDADKRSFQGAYVVLKAGRNRVMQPCTGPWAGSWGGSAEAGADPGRPLSFTLLVDHRQPTPKAGGLTIVRVEALPAPK